MILACCKEDFMPNTLGVFDLTTIIYNLGLVVGCDSLYSLYIINYSPNWLFLLKTSGGEEKISQINKIHIV